MAAVNPPAPSNLQHRMGDDPTTVQPSPVGDIELAVSVASHPGRVRESNQDSFLVMDLEVESEVTFAREVEEPDVQHSGRFTLGPGGALLLVADGMGGVSGGAEASAIAANHVREFMTTEWSTDGGAAGPWLARTLQQALVGCNREIRRHVVEHPELDGMGTTATAVGVLGDWLYIAQVGDSRAYLIRDGGIQQLTRDQSLVQQLVESGVPRVEAEESSHRHILLQALGTQPGVEVDLTRQQVRRGDVLLLCSDGLTTQLRAEEIARMVNVTPDPTVACRSLISLANERGGPDNITIICCAFDGDGVSPPDGGDSVGYQPYRPTDFPDSGGNDDPTRPDQPRVRVP